MLKKLFASFLLLLIAGLANAEIPKNVQLLIPYGPGGVADVQYRHLEQYLGKKGITLVGVYKPGANSTIAAQTLVDSPKDGSVIMLNSTSNSWLAEQRIGKKINEPLVTSGINSNVVITYPGSKYEKYDDFVKALRAGDADLKIGWHAVATLLNIHQMADKTGSPLPLTVPYKTSTDSSRDVAGKHLPVAFVPWATAKPLVEAGAVKVIFGFSPNKSDILPSHFVDLRDKIPSWNHGELFFYSLPPDTPEAVVKAWTALLKEYLNTKETDEVFKAAYFVRYVGGADLINSTIQNQATLIKKYKVEIK